MTLGFAHNKVIEIYIIFANWTPPWDDSEYRIRPAQISMSCTLCKRKLAYELSPLLLGLGGSQCDFSKRYAEVVVMNDRS